MNPCFKSLGKLNFQVIDFDRVVLIVVYAIADFSPQTKEIVSSTFSYP